LEASKTFGATSPEARVAWDSTFFVAREYAFCSRMESN
jgi:hypothetical protein